MIIQDYINTLVDLGLSEGVIPMSKKEFNQLCKEFPPAKQKEMHFGEVSIYINVEDE